MFDQCNTLLELNAARAKMVGLVDIAELNNKYNIRKQEILSQRNSYKRLEKIEYIPDEFQLTTYIPIGGQSVDPNIIGFSDKGLLIYM